MGTNIYMLLFVVVTFYGNNFNAAYAYEYGYHPSAEEFDSLLRETRTWTRDLLANERRRSWNVPERNIIENAKPSHAYNAAIATDTEATAVGGGGGGGGRREAGVGSIVGSIREEPRYVPKYNAEQLEQRYKTTISPPRRHWFVNDAEDAVGDFNIAATAAAVGGGINFQTDQIEPIIFESVQPLAVPSQNVVADAATFHIQSDLIEISEPNKHLPTELPGPRPLLKPIVTTTTNGSDNFPIFFTNPATGIVYAITQVGHQIENGNLSVLNAADTLQQQQQQQQQIPIYITKAQYDNDIKALQQQYEYNCQTKAVTSQISSSSSTTQRPQIIRIQKRPNGSSSGSTSISKLPNAQQMDLHINNQIKLPATAIKVPATTATTTTPVKQRRPHQTATTNNKKTSKPNRTNNKKKTKKNKNKRKNTKPPGHHKQGATTKPAVQSNQQPQIILGTTTTRKQASTAITMKPTLLSTQLERPHHNAEHPTTMTTTVFSKHPFVSSSGYIDVISKKSYSNSNQTLQQHQRHRRAATAAVADIPAANTKELIKETVIATKTARRTPSSKRRRKQQTSKRSTPSKKRNDNHNSTHGLSIPIAVQLLHRKHNASENEIQDTKYMSTTLSPKADLLTTTNTTTTTTKPKMARSSAAIGIQNLKNKKNQNKSLIKKHKSKYRGTENGFDLFDLVGAGSDIDEDYEDDDDDDASDDDEDSYYYGDDAASDSKPKKKIQRLQLDNSNYSIADLKEKIPDENSSSAEEGADFGAMEIEQQTLQQIKPQQQPQETPTLTQAIVLPVYDDNIDMEESESESGIEFVTQSENTKNNKNQMSKKRIRRRPPASSISSSSEEDYDDRDDDVAGVGIGSFFRMIFYPVQVAMSRIMDGISGARQDDEDDDNHDDDDDKQKYPSYTLYNNAINMAGSNEVLAATTDSKEDTQINDSFSDWFGSWFGYSRKTKKISSTTVAPLAPPPPSTTKPEPSWFESWFGYGSSTEDTAVDEEEENDSSAQSWFFSWFDTKPPKAQRRTTTTTTPTPQVPILTIVDPLRNPQNWIGILAHHIVNATSTSTSTTTHNPLIDVLTRVTATTTTTTTDNPDIPRRINYEKYQIWRLKPQDEAQVHVLEEFKKTEEGAKLHWLKGPSLRGLTDVLLPPKLLVDFQGTLNFEGIAYEVLIYDVGKAIAYEKSKEDYLFTTPTTKATKRKPTATETAAMPIITWNKYYAYDDIIKYLETIRMRHTQIVELIHIGRSYEGRPLVVVKIESKQSAAAAAAAAAATANSNHKKLKHKRRSGQANAVFIEAGTHGMAWIGPAAATWMISELLRLMRTNKTTSYQDAELIRNTTWYIMPVLNPDGYVYSHEYDRFWKKSRSRHISKANNGLLNSAMTWLQQKKQNDKICYGVDLDRNWQYQWGKRGSSKSPCNEFYAGPTQFSEPESKALSEFLMDYRTQIKLYISLQAYGQVLSYPIKANSTFNTERMDDFLDVAMVGTDGLRKKGSKARYKIDSANDLIEQRSGCADAFAAYEIGIPFSYTLQLADNGVHGYLLPSSSIESTARDAFEIITGMVDYI